MPAPSTRALAALAFERGEKFDPAVTLPSAPLAEDLALLAGAQALVCELSPMERRRRRERALRDARARKPSELALGQIAPVRRPRTLGPK
jgi:hypothetical protein